MNEQQSQPPYRLTIELELWEWEWNRAREVVTAIETKIVQGLPTQAQLVSSQLAAAAAGRARS